MHERNAGKAMLLCLILLSAAVLQALWQTPGVRAWLRNTFSIQSLAAGALYLQTGLYADPEPRGILQSPPEQPSEQEPAVIVIAPAAEAPTERQAEPSAESEPGEQSEPPAESEPEEPQESPEETPETSEPPQAEALNFDAAEAERIQIFGECTYSVDKAALLTRPLEWKQSVPAVLIVHTHTTEAYAMEDGQAYDALSSARTLDENYNMVRVGREVADVLEGNGITVYHNTTVNDYPSYSGAYDRMKTVIEQELAAHPEIQVVLDIHRDAASDEDGNPLAETVWLDGTDYAQLMLVMGTDEGGLYHPDWQDNLSCALKLQALLNRDYDGLCKHLNLRQERFNENQTPGSMLVEFGCNGNTLTQALRTARVFGQALSELLLAKGT